MTNLNNTSAIFYQASNASTPTSSSLFDYQSVLQNTTLSPVNRTFIDHSSHLHSSFERNGFKIIMVVIYAIIFLIGVPGNVLVIMTIIRVPKMRTVKNIFIANLAIGDLINILWCLSTSLVSLYVSWPYGEAVCKYIFPIADVIIANTIFTMVAITIDRYRAIVHPLSSKMTLTFSIVVVVFSWILSYCLVGIPLVTRAKVSGGYWVEKSCNVQWEEDYKVTYRVLSFIFLFCVPFIIVLYCFCCIKNRLQENMLFASASIRGRTSLNRTKKHQRLIKLLFVMFLCFIICFLPINSLLLITTFDTSLYMWRYAGILFQIAIAFFFSNSIMNPIILFLLSNDWKYAYLKQIKCFVPDSKEITRRMSMLRKRAFSTTSTISEYDDSSRRTSTILSFNNGKRRTSTLMSVGSNGTVHSMNGYRHYLNVNNNTNGKYPRRDSTLSEELSDDIDATPRTTTQYLYPKTEKRKKSVTWSKTSNSTSVQDEVEMDSSLDVVSEGSPLKTSISPRRASGDGCLFNKDEVPSSLLNRRPSPLLTKTSFHYGDSPTGAQYLIRTIDPTSANQGTTSSSSSNHTSPEHQQTINNCLVNTNENSTLLPLTSPKHARSQIKNKKSSMKAKRRSETSPLHRKAMTSPQTFV